MYTCRGPSLAAGLLVFLALSGSAHGYKWASSLSVGWPGSARLFDWSRAGYMSGDVAPPAASKFVSKNAVTDFKLNRDGKTDNSAKLQAAINSLSAAGGGGLYFPAGTYVLNSPVVISSSNILLWGAGPGKTKIYIPRSLSDWKPGTWSISSSGSVNTAWSYGGAFISFSGSDAVKSKLANVLADAPRGTTTLTVSDTSNVKAGDWVALRLYDPDAAVKAMAAGLGGNASTAGGGTSAAGGVALPSAPLPSLLHGLTLPLGWEKDPILSQAVMATFEAEDGHEHEEEDGGKAGAASVAPPAAESSSSSGGGGTVVPASVNITANGTVVYSNATADGKAPAAAASGSLTAWIYGNNLAYSGERWKQLSDNIRFAAKVVSVNDSTRVVTLDRPIPYPVKTSWNAQLWSYRPSLNNSGIQGMSIEFKWDTYLRHFTEKGYNAITFVNTANCWARNLVITNADLGIATTAGDWTTMTGITAGVTTSRAGPISGGTNGHHALWVTRGQETLVEKSSITAPFVHDLSVEKYATLNVFSTITGVNLNMASSTDNHRSASFANLFSNINIGYGTRPFSSGGSGPRGANAGIYQTWWNIYTNANGWVPLPACSSDFGAYLNFAASNWSGNTCSKLQWAVQGRTAGQPADIYRGMNAYRKALAKQAAAKAALNKAPALPPALSPAPAPASRRLMAA